MEKFDDVGSLVKCTRMVGVFSEADAADPGGFVIEGDGAIDTVGWS